MANKYLSLDMLVVILLGIYLILLILGNEKAYLIGIPAYCLFLVLSIIKLIKERKSKY